MVARFSGASLGLLAFAVTVTAGLYARNPVEVTLSRSVLALFLFYGVGLLLGGVADKVVAEHRSQCESRIDNRPDEDSAVDNERGDAGESPEDRNG